MCLEANKFCQKKSNLLKKKKKRNRHSSFESLIQPVKLKQTKPNNKTKKNHRFSLRARVFCFLSLLPSAHFSGHYPMTLSLCTLSNKECFLWCSFMWAGQLAAMWQPTDTDTHSWVLSFLNSHFHHDQDEHDFPGLFKGLISSWSPSGRVTLTFKDLIKDKRIKDTSVSSLVQDWQAHTRYTEVIVEVMGPADPLHISLISQILSL